MIEARRRKDEPVNSLVYRFSKKVRRSGVMAEVRKRRFRSREENKRARRESALYREKRKKEIERNRTFGTL